MEMQCVSFGVVRYGVESGEWRVESGGGRREDRVIEAMTGGGRNRLN